MLEELVRTIADMEEELALQVVREFVSGGGDPQQVLDACREAMDLVGKRFEDGEYFLPELMLAGDLLEQISAIVKPLLVGGPQASANTAGTVLIGTVHGDLHDIGKNIVVFMLEVNGYNVIDLGIDVPVEDFVDKVRELKPPVLALSGFLTLAFDSMKETIDALSDAGLRDSLKIMIGGGQVDEAVRSYTNADAFGLNAMDAVSLCRQWLAA
ncbi:MAG: cobalamin-dependent protein [Actinomycetota bacterium]|nr:cobalamin-dependent protein [Actinomycetota bacterium]